VLSRISVLAARPRHTLGALAVVLAAVGVAVGSGANFTAHVASAGNTFSAGTLSIGGGGSAILTAILSSSKCSTVYLFWISVRFMKLAIYS